MLSMPTGGDLKEFYKKAESRAEENSEFERYFDLIRVGTSVMFAGLGAMIISVLLFAPTLSFFPYGRHGQVLIGIPTSIAAFKIYGVLKLSNKTVLSVGKESSEDNRIQKIVTESATSRLLLSLGAIFIAYFLLALLFATLILWTESTGYSADGISAEVASGMGPLFPIIVIIFGLGTVVNLSGVILAAWALTKPFRVFIVSVYRIVDYRTKVFMYNKIEDASGISHYQEPDFICNYCYNTSFKLVGNNGESEGYEAICMVCTEKYNTPLQEESLSKRVLGED